MLRRFSDANALDMTPSMCVSASADYETVSADSRSTPLPRRHVVGTPNDSGKCIFTVYSKRIILIIIVNNHQHHRISDGEDRLSDL